jgi:hypothetical protein
VSQNASIAQEFYKVREEWARVDKLKSWKLAVWVCQYQDVDIVDKFLEIERLPIGVFDDLFFRFDSEYKGDPEAFEKELWEEYESWFAAPPEEKQDMMLALKNDGVLAPDFEPRINCEAGFAALVQEMLRLKAALKGFDREHFCLYFPPTRPGTSGAIGTWLQAVLKRGISEGIRLVTIDYAAKRGVNIPNRRTVVEITPHLNMMQAINNEMDKGGGSSDAVGVDSRFRKQIRVVMESTLKKDPALTGKEVKKMLSISKEMGNASSVIAALLVAGQAHYTIKDNEQSELYVDEAIVKAEAAMKKGDVAGYHSWKACTMLKGALLSGKRKWDKAIVLYENMAEQAVHFNDYFFVMEGYRISGHLYYLRGRLQPAFEKSLLALVAGSYLDKTMVRQSTFLHAAYLAVFIGRKIKTPDELQILEAQLQDWLGEDWRELIDSSELEASTTKPKSSLLPF